MKKGSGGMLEDIIMQGTRGRGWRLWARTGRRGRRRAGWSLPNGPGADAQGPTPTAPPPADPCLETDSLHRGGQARPSGAGGGPGRGRGRWHGHAAGRVEPAFEGRALSDLDPGERCRIFALHGRGAIRHRLLDLGLVPNAEVEVVRRAPLADPIEVRMGDTFLTLRRSEAARVEVVPA